MTNRKILFSFKGRITRKEYWIGYLINSLIFLVPLVVFAIYGAAEIVNAIAYGEMAQSYAVDQSEWTGFILSTTSKAIAILIVTPFFIVGIWSGIAIFIKRLHDLNFSGWFTLVIFLSSLILAGIPYLVISIVLGCIQGTIGPNKYGPDPLANP